LVTVLVAVLANNVLVLVEVAVLPTVEVRVRVEVTVCVAVLANGVLVLVCVSVAT
jgi:hypothetical protein